MVWLRNGDLQCDTCDQVFESLGPRVAHIDAARAKGWHVFRGSSVTGKDLDTALCPNCIGTNRSAVKKPPRFSEEEPLF